MSNELTEWQRIKLSLNTMLNKTSIDHLLIAHDAKMTLYEMLKCQEISEHQSVPIDHVFKKMAVFKASSAHILYKKDFTYN